MYYCGMKIFSFRVDALGDFEGAQKLWHAMKAEQSDPQRGLKYHNNITVAALVIDGIVESAIFYVPIDSEKIVTVAGEYTRPDRRRRGYFKILWELFVNYIAKFHPEIDNIQSGFFTGDVVGHQTLVSLGYKEYEVKPNHTRMRFWIKNPWRPQVYITPSYISKIADELEKHNKTNWLTVVLNVLFGMNSRTQEKRDAHLPPR